VQLAEDDAIAWLDDGLAVRHLPPGGAAVIAAIRRRIRRAAYREVVAWMRSNAYVTMADRVARAFDVDR